MSEPQPTPQTAPPAELHPWEILPQEVDRLRRSKADFLLLDCRKPEEDEICRIEGATLVPMQDLDLHMDTLRQHEDQLIVVYCHSGRRSMTLTTVLREQGFSNVRSMAGGIHRWSLEIDPSVPTYKK